jgi:hypothetical protein
MRHRQMRAVDRNIGRECGLLDRVHNYLIDNCYCIC